MAHRMTRLGLIVLGVTAIGLSGCAALSPGKNDFDCPGKPDGVLCVSAHEAYAATDNGNVPIKMTREGDKDGKTPAHGDELLPEGAKVAAERDPVIDDYVAPRIPNRPIPVRTPAKVMRIWVAPWEDKNGNLNVSGYVYTEIEPRKWVIGNGQGQPDPVIEPLQVSDMDSGNVGARGAGATGMTSRRGGGVSGQVPYSPLPQ